MSVLHVTAYFFLFWSFAIPIPLYVCRPPTSVTTDNQDKEKWIFDSFEMRDSAKHLSDLPVCSALFFLLFSPQHHQRLDLSILAVQFYKSNLEWFQIWSNICISIFYLYFCLVTINHNVQMRSTCACLSKKHYDLVCSILQGAHGIRGH